MRNNPVLSAPIVSWNLLLDQGLVTCGNWSFSLICVWCVCVESRLRRVWNWNSIWHFWENKTSCKQTQVYLLCGRCRLYPQCSASCWLQQRLHQHIVSRVWKENKTIINVTLEHKSSLKSLGYISSNSQKYTIWVKVIHFYLMPKIIRTLNKDHVPWRYLANFLS